MTGDPDQSIYGWRGADINNILEFERDFPQVKVVRLEAKLPQHASRILRIADQLIRHNIQRKAKVAVHRKRRRAPGAADALRRPGRRSPRTSPSRFAESDRRRLAGRANDSPSSTAMNALSRSVGARPPRSAACPTKWSAGRSFTSARKSRTCWRTASCSTIRATIIACARAINTPSRGIGERRSTGSAQHAYEYGLALLGRCSRSGAGRRARQTDRR